MPIGGKIHVCFPGWITALLLNFSGFIVNQSDYPPNRSLCVSKQTPTTKFSIFLKPRRSVKFGIQQDFCDSNVNAANEMTISGPSSAIMQMESFSSDAGKSAEVSGENSSESLSKQSKRRVAMNKIKGLVMLLHFKVVCAGLFSVFNLYWIAYNYAIAQHEAIGGFVFVLCSILYFWCLCWLEYGVHERSTTDYTQRSFLVVTVMLLTIWIFAAASLVLTCAIGVTYDQASHYLKLVLNKRIHAGSFADDAHVKELERLLDDPSSFHELATSRAFIQVMKYTDILFMFFPLITVAMIQSMIYTFQKTDYFIYKIAKQDYKLAAKVAPRMKKTGIDL